MYLQEKASGYIKIALEMSNSHLHKEFQKSLMNRDAAHDPKKIRHFIVMNESECSLDTPDYLDSSENT